MRNMIISIVVIAIVLVAALFLINLRSTSNPPTELERFGTNPTTAPPAAQPTTQVTNPVVSPLESPSASESAQAENAKKATIETVKGTIEIELYPQDAPKTVKNFAVLSQRGFYNNLTFHRVEPGFVIQGGDPSGDGTGGTSIYGPTFEDELNPNSPSYQAGYMEGVVAMANRGPNTNSSQFFIMLADNTSLPKNYTIFGKVTTGMDVVKKIAKGDKMTKITIE